MNQLAYDQREYDKLHNFEKKDIHDWAQEDSIIQAYQGKYWSHDLKMNDSDEEEAERLNEKFQKMTPKEKEQEL